MKRIDWWREWIGDYGALALGLASGVGGGFALLFLLGPPLGTGPADPSPSLRAEVQRQRVEIDSLRRQLAGGPPPADLPAEALIPKQDLPTK